MKPLLDVLPDVSKEMEARGPIEVLTWACDTYGDKLAMATAFGAEGCALISMLSQINNRVFLFNIDTGYQFPETLQLRDRLMDKYGVQVHLVGPEESTDQLEARHGGALYNTNPDLCCYLRKIVPLRNVISGYDAWISAIRREQTANRAVAPIVGWDAKFGLVKVNPLANWSRREVWDYIVKNNVPYNPLHDQGYPSIGCLPCTRAVGVGDDERAGRWAGFAKKECGLHVMN